jgi:hypothetical protein
MVGGTDIVLVGPSHLGISDLILRVCRDRWSECRFQDADSTDIRKLDDPWVWHLGTLSTEFFVYRDDAAATDWTKQGASPVVMNSMLHFIMRDLKQDGPSHVEVTLVCDQTDEVVSSIVDSLKSAFLCAMSDVEQRKAA